MPRGRVHVCPLVVRCAAWYSSAMLLVHNAVCAVPLAVLLLCQLRGAATATTTNERHCRGRPGYEYLSSAACVAERQRAGLWGNCARFWGWSDLDAGGVVRLEARPVHGSGVAEAASSPLAPTAPARPPLSPPSPAGGGVPSGPPPTSQLPTALHHSHRRSFSELERLAQVCGCAVRLRVVLVHTCVTLTVRRSWGWTSLCLPRPRAARSTSRTRSCCPWRAQASPLEERCILGPCAALASATNGGPAGVPLALPLPLSPETSVRCTR